MKIKMKNKTRSTIIGFSTSKGFVGVSGYSGFQFSSSYIADGTCGVNASLQEPFDWFMKIFCDCGEIEWVTVEEIPGWHIVNGSPETKHRRLLICKNCGTIVVTENYKIVKKVGQIKPEAIDALKLVQDLRENFKNGKGLEDAPKNGS